MKLVVLVTVYMWWAGLPDTAAEPSPKFQLNAYGLVPPEADAVNVTSCPEVGEVGVKVKSVAIGCAATVTLAVPLMVTLLPSVAVAVTVCEPLAANVVV